MEHTVVIRIGSTKQLIGGKNKRKDKKVSPSHGERTKKFSLIRRAEKYLPSRIIGDLREGNSLSKADAGVIVEGFLCLHTYGGEFQKGRLRDRH